MTIPRYDNQPQNNQLSKCPNCGNEVGDWDFCFYCGTNLKAQSVDGLTSEENEQIDSEIDNTPDDTVDPLQETTEVKAPVCPNCGKEIGEWDFCFYCGTNLKAQSVTELPDEKTEPSESSQDNISDGTIDNELQEVVEIKAPVCPNCGKEIGEWDFCFHCGTNLKATPIDETPNEEIKAPESTMDNTPDVSIDDQQKDEETEAPMCPNCGKEIGEWDFCFHCGTNLKSPPVVEKTDEEFEIIKSLVANETANAVPELQNESNTGNEELPETQNDNIIVLEDENGNSVEFEFLDLIQYRGKEYVVLLPNDDSIEKVIILQLEETSDGVESYLSVDNDYTLQVIFEIFKERAKNDFNFVD